MNSDQLGAAFRQIAEDVRAASDPKRCWSQILNVSGQDSNERLADLDVNADIHIVHMQLAEIFKALPPAQNLAFFYFGLFDRPSGTAYYVSGYEAPDAIGTLTNGEKPSFFPANCHLSSHVLEAVDAEIARTPAEQKVLAYAVTFGAGAVLSRFATLALKLPQPVYVGFDSGDFARVK